MNELFKFTPKDDYNSEAQSRSSPGWEFPPPNNKQAKFNSGGMAFDYIELLTRINVLLRYQYKLYMLDDGIYKKFDEGTFINFVFTYLLSNGIELPCKEVRDIVNELKMRANTIVVEPNDERYTYCRNGYYNNQTGTMENIAPSDYFPTIQLAGAYHSELSQHHPMMDSFLATIFNSDSLLIARAWECIGYCIVSDCHAKRFFVFPGSTGDNGKSALLALIRGLFKDYSAIADMSMKNILSGRFALSELLGKRINFSSDEGAMTLDTSQLAVLKRISGHDYIMADRKNTTQVGFLCTCKIVIASNHNIGMAYTNGDSAVMRRICTLPFDVKIPKSAQDPNIVGKILASELDAITTEAINAYYRLKNRDYRFMGDDTGLDAYTITSTPANDKYFMVGDFVDKFIKPEQKSFVLTQELYNCFVDNYGDIFKDITGFSQALLKSLEARGFTVNKTKIHQGNGYEGVAIRR